MLKNQEQAQIAIVILNWNQFEDTAECLESLRRVRGPRFNVILVDNGSKDGSPDRLAAQFREIHLIRNAENLGFVGGNNAGIRMALDSGADYILLLNNDTVVSPEFLSELLKTAERHPAAGIVGARVVYHDRPDVLWGLGGKLQQPFARIKMIGKGENAARVGDLAEEFDHITGAVMLVRSEVFRQLGLLDTDFFLNWEDVEFCIRAKCGGWSVMGSPGSLVRHKVSRATAGKLATYFGQRNRLLFTSRHLPRWQFAICVVPFHVARLAVLVVTQTFSGRVDLVKAATLGTVDFFRGRLGKGSMDLVQRL